MDFRDKTMTQNLPLCDTVDREGHPKGGGGNQLYSEDWMRSEITMWMLTTDKCGEMEESSN